MTKPYWTLYEAYMDRLKTTLITVSCRFRSFVCCHCISVSNRTTTRHRIGGTDRSPNANNLTSRFTRVITVLPFITVMLGINLRDCLASLFDLDL